MSNLLRFPTLNDFLIHNEERLRSTPFRFWHLNGELDKVFSGSLPAQAFVTAEGTDDSYIISLFTRSLWLASAAWTSDLATELGKRISWQQLPNPFIQGQPILIRAVLNSVGISYDFLRERTIYECSSRSFQELDIHPEGTFERCTCSDVERIQELHWSWYSGESTEYFYLSPKEKVIEGIERGVEEGRFFCWKKDNYILGYSHLVMDDNWEFPLPNLASFYVDETVRSKGIGSALLAKTTAYALENLGQMVGLVGNDANTTANKVFQKCGYYPVDNHGYAKIADDK